MKFYLGSHKPNWLESESISLFVSNRRLKDRRKLYPALAPWCLDSGGFSELSLFGAWETSTTEYIEAVERYSEEIGNLAWAAPQDWMCEPVMLGRTGMSVIAHQRRTVLNYLDLTERAPHLPFIPVLQGWTLEDYVRCIELYSAWGVDLPAAPTVGLGSVCRRQGTDEIEEIVRTLHGYGLKMHGFGVKTLGLARYGKYLQSADSLAWSYNARHRPALPGCTTHKNCANCILFARRWRYDLISRHDFIT